MNLVKDLDLQPAGKIHLRPFLEEKRPRNQNEKITVCVYYLRRILELDNITYHHVYTCMHDAKIRVPNDLPQTIRNIAKRKGWLDTSNSNAIDITQRGLNLVDNDLSGNDES